MPFIGEREIKEFRAEQNGDWIIVDFVNGEKLEISGTLFFKIQTEQPVPNVTTTQLVASYFATELLKGLAMNRIQLGMLSHIMNAIENITEVKKERAFTRQFGHKYILQVGFDQMLSEADAAEQEDEAMKENERLAAEQAAKAAAAEGGEKHEEGNKEV